MKLISEESLSIKKIEFETISESNKLSDYLEKVEEKEEVIEEGLLDTFTNQFLQNLAKPQVIEAIVNIILNNQEVINRITTAFTNKINIRFEKKQ